MGATLSSRTNHAGTLKSPLADADIEIHEEGTMPAPPDADVTFADQEYMSRTINAPRVTSRSLSADDVCELRRLIREDAYNRVHIAVAIARRMLRSGDV